MSKKLKICMVGATGVGKTSLVRRFVQSIFSDAYLTTVGVTIDKARVRRDGEDVDLVLWDLSGQDEFQSVQLAYLRGAAGYLLVVDGTRRETLTTALTLESAAAKLIGAGPLVVALNKADRADEWELGDDEVYRELTSKDRRPAGAFALIKTSAKTGEGVARAFETLVDEILGSAHARAGNQ